MAKTPLSKITDEFLTACAESEGITEPKEVKAYVKSRKKSIKATIKKDAK